jgi:hypothetical protein
MAILLLVIFFPWRNHMVYLNRELKLLFYLFGWILLFTADWSLFFHEAPWFHRIQAIWS